MKTQIRVAIFALAASLLLVGASVGQVQAQEPASAKKKNSFQFQGFATGLMTLEEGATAEEEVGHLWLIGKQEIVEDKLNLLVILAPEGPPKLLHSAWFTWQKPVPRIDAVRFGRHIPSFGHEFHDYRVDQAPTIGFSSTVKPLVARVNGLEVESHVGKLQIIGGAFTGNRVGGDIPEHDASWDLYLRLRRPVVGKLLAGASFRESDKDAVGADLTWKSKSGRLLGAAEYTRSDHSEWYVLGEGRVSERFKGTLRIERLRNDEWRLVLGPTIEVAEGVELKLDAVLSDEQANKLLAQVAIRW